MNLAKFFQWHHLSRLPSAWLLLVQLLILILAPLTNDSLTSHAISWSLSALALLLLATIIRNSPIFTGLGLFFVIVGLGLSSSVLLGFDSPSVHVATNLIEAVAYFYGAAGLLMYILRMNTSRATSCLPLLRCLPCWLGVLHFCTACARYGTRAVSTPLPAAPGHGWS